MSVDEQKMTCVRIRSVGGIQNGRRLVDVIALTTKRAGVVSVREEHWKTIDRVYTESPYAIFSVAKSSGDVEWH